VATPVLHAALSPAALGPASRYVLDSREALLSYETDELAALRFSIILTARWEAAEDEEPEARAALRSDLDLLRRHYGDKIDDIAMTFGVEAAIQAQDEVEQNVIVPHDWSPSQPRSEKSFDSTSCEADDMGEYGL
jgi:hypothetical protein